MTNKNRLFRSVCPHLRAADLLDRADLALLSAQYTPKSRRPGAIPAVFLRFLGRSGRGDAIPCFCNRTASGAQGVLPSVEGSGFVCREGVADLHRSDIKLRQSNSKAHYKGLLTSDLYLTSGQKNTAVSR